MRAGLSAGLAFTGAAVARRRELAGPAAASAAAVGAAFESPVAGATVAAAALASRCIRPQGLPPGALVAVVAGAAAAVATRRAWPVAPKDAPAAERASTRIGAPPLPDGDDVTVVVNAGAGPALRRDQADAVRAALPRATVLEVDDDTSMDDVLSTLETSPGRAVGAVGGDGTVNAVAAIAHRAGVPLVVVPGGTLNHFARDLGVGSADEAAAAVREGSAINVDLATIAGKPFLNTASFGTYGELVDARERLERRIGKWPALVVALVHVLRTAQPMDVEVDGRRRRLWMVFVGNCRYEPPGFAPSWRPRLDDGALDVRVVDAAAPWARLSLVVAVLTGRLARCRAYETWTATEVTVRSLDGPLRLAHDGETFDGPASFTIAKDPTPVVVYTAPD